MCGLCPPGWALTGSGCSSCPDQSTLGPLRNAAISIFVIVCAILWYIFSWRPLSSDGGEANDSGEDTSSSKCDVVNLKKHVASITDGVKSFYEFFFGKKSDEPDFWKDILSSIAPYFKLYVTFFQILSSFLTFGVTWPSLLLNMMKWLKATIFLDILTLPGLSCLWNGVSFKSRLLTYTLTPLAVIFCLILPVIYSYLCFWLKQKHVQESVVNAAWKNLMFWLFLIYPMVSLATLQAFDCRPLGLGKLAADFTVDCPDANSFLRVWSYIFIAVYPIGIPVFCYISMLQMGVHLVARDMKNELLLRALVSKFASFNERSRGKFVSQSDCIQGFCVTKQLAIQILTFDFMGGKQQPAPDIPQAKLSVKQKQDQGESEDPNKASYCSVESIKQKCMPWQSKPLTQEQKVHWLQTIAQDEIKSKYLSVALFKLANDLLRDRIISIPSLSWNQGRNANNEEIIVNRAKTSFAPEDLKCFESLQTSQNILEKFAIHPAMDDSHTWTFMEKVQTFIGSGSWSPSAEWKSVLLRKRMKDRAVERVGFVFAAYRVDFWFWEMIEMLRK